MLVIGIDPGLSGAIAILEDKKVLNILDMPVMADGKKTNEQIISKLKVKNKLFFSIINKLIKKELLAYE